MICKEIADIKFNQVIILNHMQTLEEEVTNIIIALLKWLLQLIAYMCILIKVLEILVNKLKIFKCPIEETKLKMTVYSSKF